MRIDNQSEVSSGEVTDDLNEFGCEDGQEGSGEVTEDLELLRWKKNPPNKVNEKIHLFHTIETIETMDAIRMESIRGTLCMIDLKSEIGFSIKYINNFKYYRTY